MLDDLPPPVRRHLEQEIIAPSLVAWIRAEDGRIREHGTSDETLSETLADGLLVDDVLPVFVGLLPLQGRSLCLRSVTLGDWPPLDIHAFESEGGTWLLLVDEGQRGLGLRELLDRVNRQALELRQERRAAEMLEDLVSGLDAVVFEPLGGSDLRLISAAPDWLQASSGDVEPGERLEASSISDYVHDFLLVHGDEPNHPPRFKPCLPWVEKVEGFGSLAREGMIGWGKSTRPFFLLRRLGAEFADRIRPIQVGREIDLHRRELLQQIEEKDVLLHCVVHDLSNPLSTVLTGLELLEGSTDGDQEVLRRTALGEAFRQRDVIESLLDIFRAERMDDETEPTDLASVIARLEPGARLSASLRKVSFRVNKPDVTLTVLADPVRLERVLQNLIENALRVSPVESEVVLRVDADAKWARIAVEDEGPGVPDSEREEIFMKLRRGTGTSGRLGLGLYFCRITAERWGGRISQANRRPHGSSFELQLRWSESRPTGSS